MDARRLGPRLALAAVSFCAASGVAWWWVGDRLGGGAPGVANDYEGARGLLLERARQAGPRDAGAGVMPEVIPEADAKTLFPSLGNAETIYDPLSHYRYRGGMDMRVPFADLPSKTYHLRTNSWGMRESDEPNEAPGQPCVLATGDSHTDGVCDTADSWANQLESLLRARPASAGAAVWNTGMGGFSFYEYLGTLRRCRELAPKLYVVCSYAGNDYLELMRPWAYFERREPPQVPEEALKSVLRESVRSPQAISQCLQQACYFRDLPDTRELAVRIALKASREIAAEASAAGCVTLFVHLPCAADVQRERYQDVLGRACERLALSSTDLDVSQRLADGWIRGLRESQLNAIDLRDVFRAAPQDLYWRSDHHINLVAQRLLAEQVLAWIDAQPPGAVLPAANGSH
jgi:hypothetical protein